MQRLKVVKILAALVAALSILNSSGASPGTTEKVVVLLACTTCSGASHSSAYSTVHRKALQAGSPGENQVGHY